MYHGLTGSYPVALVERDEIVDTHDGFPDEAEQVQADPVSAFGVAGMNFHM